MTLLANQKAEGCAKRCLGWRIFWLRIFRVQIASSRPDTIVVFLLVCVISPVPSLIIFVSICGLVTAVKNVRINSHQTLTPVSVASDVVTELQ